LPTKFYPSLRYLLFFYAMCFLSFDLNALTPFYLLFAYKSSLILDVLNGFRYTAGIGNKTPLAVRMWIDVGLAWAMAITFYNTTPHTYIIVAMSGLAFVLAKKQPRWAKRATAKP